MKIKMLWTKKEDVPTSQNFIKKDSPITIGQKEKWLKRFPMLSVSVLLTITLYLSLWAWVKNLSLAMSHYQGKEVFYLPLLFGKFTGVSILWIPLTAAISIFGWLLSTRVSNFKTPKWRILIFFNLIFALMGMIAGLGMTQIQEYLLPFFYERIDRIIETSASIDQALFEQTQGFFFMLEMMPMILILFMGMFIVTKYRQHDEQLKNAFFQFEWKGERLRRFEEMGKRDDSIVPFPDIHLGLGRKTNEMVVLPGQDRTLNTIITGSIGTGKTAALGLPTINQDLHSITRFMNDFPRIRRLDNYISEDVQGRYLNGLSVIDPSNDLCKKVYMLAKAHGIPDEAITYIDPTNPNTPNFNPMQGPVDKVAEVFAQVVAGLADSGGGGNFFFEQAQRIHLKQHIYLLKMHNPEKEVTFDMLLDMYNDTLRVHEMHVELKSQFPPNYNEIDKLQFRDEYNHWQILKGLDEWFDNTIVPKEQRTPQGTFPMRDDYGQIIYIDAEAEYVKGLRNILNDIGANPLIRRVLFGPSKFNFDDHMGSTGGILLLNTAKGELEALGNVLGKIILMSLQNASFRRPANVATFHHILVDEAPEYLYGSFASFPAQSRKYKVILTILQQTLTQLRGAFGEDYMNTIVAAMRNRMVYADVSAFDSKYFSDMFGEKEVYQEGESEQSVSPLQDNPISRSGSNYSRVKEEALSSSEILFQEAFECAVKIVVNNKTMPVQQIKANFVPKEEFEVAIVQVEPEAAAEWIKVRFNEIVEVIDGMNDAELTEVEESISLLIEPAPILATNSSVAKKGELDPLEMEQALSIEKPVRPSDTEIQYDSSQSEQPVIRTGGGMANVIVPRATQQNPTEPLPTKTVEISSDLSTPTTPSNTLVTEDYTAIVENEKGNKFVASIIETTAPMSQQSNSTVGALSTQDKGLIYEEVSLTSAKPTSLEADAPKEKLVAVDTNVEEVDILTKGARPVKQATPSTNSTKNEYVEEVLEADTLAFYDSFPK